MVKTISNFCTFYNTFCLQEKGQKVAKICLTRSQSTFRFSQRPLFTFTLKVNEQFWKFPEGRIAPGLRPFDDSKFSSCLVNRGLCSPEGCCAGTEDGAVTAPEVDWLSSPSMKEVRAADICLNWLSVGRSQQLSMLVSLLCPVIALIGRVSTFLQTEQWLDCCRSQWMVCQVRLDSCSFCHLSQ